MHRGYAMDVDPDTFRGDQALFGRFHDVESWRCSTVRATVWPALSELQSFGPHVIEWRSLCTLCEFQADIYLKRNLCK